MTDFGDFLEALEEDSFEEIPVDIEEFVTSKDYLGLPPLSEYQYTMIKASTQIYKKETLVKLYGEVEGEKRWKQTCNEVILQLGKGSGKDYSSTIACAYIVYLLLCLKDPATYYGKPPGDPIDILNIAINSEQAKNVFFKGFNTRIDRSPWFQGKYNPKASSIEFNKTITVHSGHSQRESWEGYNVLVVVLDEISGFELESTSGNEQAKTASAIYKMYRGSVASRFPDFGKLILLSFPRFKNDFIQQRYNEVIAQKEIIIRSHTFKVDPDLPDEIEENKFTIEFVGKKGIVNTYTDDNPLIFKLLQMLINAANKKDGYLFKYDNANTNANTNTFITPEEIQKHFNDTYNAYITPKMFRTWYGNYHFLLYLKKFLN